MSKTIGPRANGKPKAIGLVPSAGHVPPGGATVRVDPAVWIPIRLARGGLDPLDKLAELLLEVVEVGEQIGFEHHEQVPVLLVRVERRAGEQPQRLHDKGQPKSLIAAER